MRTIPVAVATLAALYYLYRIVGRRYRKSLLGPSQYRTNSSLVFFVTGAAGGIGSHMTEQLLARGHRVVATDINFAQLQANLETGWKQNGSRIAIFQLDVTSVESWKAAVDFALQKFQTIDTLLNIAGYLAGDDAYNLRPEEVHRTFDINVKGVIFGCQVVAPILIAKRRGHIVNISSLAGIVYPMGIALYSASKHAVKAFSICLGMELEPHGVAVTAVCPDAVQTPMLEKSVECGKHGSLVVSGGNWLTVRDIGDLLLNEVLPNRPIISVAATSRYRRLEFWCLLNVIPLELMGYHLRKAQEKGMEVQEKLRRTFQQKNGLQ